MIDTVKRENGIKHDSAIAKILGIDRSGVTLIRKRNSITFPNLLILSEHFEISLSKLISYGEVGQ